MPEFTSEVRGICPFSAELTAPVHLTFSLSTCRPIYSQSLRRNTTNKVTHNVSINEVAQQSYVYAPQTQALVIAGSVLKQFPSGYKHDFPNGDILTAQERADIIALVDRFWESGHE